MAKMTRTEEPKPIAYVITFLVIATVIWFLFFRGGGDDPEPAQEDEAPSNLTGQFVRWEPVDDARGYAYFTITNHGSSTEVAECHVRVSNDFGNFGFDIMSGDPVPAGDTVSLRMALDVDEGSFLINEGSVDQC